MEEIKNILNENKSLLDNIESMIRNSENIAIMGHVNPDGDCIGSQLGLALALRSIGKSVDCINEGAFKTGLKETYEKHFINDIDKDYDLFIVLDVSNKERMGALSGKTNFSKTIVIDHHMTNDSFGRLNWVSGFFLSASEMVVLLLMNMNIDMSRDNISQELLNGVLSDNGFYQHVRKDKSLSLLITYLLMKDGADPNITYDMMFRNNSLSNVHMYAMLLGRMQSLYDERVFWTYLTEEDKRKFGNTDFESASLFAEMKSIKNFHIGIFFKVYESEGRVDVSFRSIDSVNVADVAEKLGGGGHKVAAGVSTKGTFPEIKEKVLDLINDLMDKMR